MKVALRTHKGKRGCGLDSSLDLDHSRIARELTCFLYISKKKYNIPKVGRAYVAAFERRWLKGSEPVV